MNLFSDTDKEIEHLDQIDLAKDFGNEGGKYAHGKNEDPDKIDYSAEDM